ncbi:MAG: hypothetical protein RLZZ420_967 [Bacteroidota bacterium]|jgi:hypothetical protein
MANKPAGNEWLKEHFGLHHYSFTHSSFIGNNPSVELSSKGSINQVYGPKYGVSEDKPLPQIEFALKYDDLSLDFLKAVFALIDSTQVEAYIVATPNGRYARKIGFL